MPGLTDAFLAIVSLPGAYVARGVQHAVYRLYKVPVYEAHYFRTDLPSGFIDREVFETADQALQVSCVIAACSLGLTVILTLSAATTFFILHSFDFTLVQWLSCWTGISTGVIAIADNDDFEEYLTLKGPVHPILSAFIRIWRLVCVRAPFITTICIAMISPYALVNLP